MFDMVWFVALGSGVVGFRSAKPAWSELGLVRFGLCSTIFCFAPFCLVRSASVWLALVRYSLTCSGGSGSFPLDLFVLDCLG